MSASRFPVYATITPGELANILDLAAKANLPVGVTIKHVAPVIARASQLASLPEGTKIGAVEVPEDAPANVPTGTRDGGAQLELPFEVTQIAA